LGKNPINLDEVIYTFCTGVNGFVLLTLSGGGNVLLVCAMVKKLSEGYFLAD